MLNQIAKSKMMAAMIIKMVINFFFIFFDCLKLIGATFCRVNFRIIYKTVDFFY